MLIRFFRYVVSVNPIVQGNQCPGKYQAIPRRDQRALHSPVTRARRGRNGKTQSRLLPSAARRRTFRFGSVPAVSPPALHLTARRTADRSSQLFFTMQPSDGNLQTFGNGRNFVIHQITILPLNAGNGGLIENDAFSRQAASQIILRNRRLAL
jgi:hypothetical protein